MSYSQEELDILQKAQKLNIALHRDRSSPKTVLVPNYGQIFIGRLRPEHKKALEAKNSAKKAVGDV